MFERWYRQIRPQAVSFHGGDVNRVLVYRDIAADVDHSPPLAGPWLLTVQFSLPFDAATAAAVWTSSVEQFIAESSSGLYVTVLPEARTEDVRATALAVWLSRELGDHGLHEKLLAHVDAEHDPRLDGATGEFAYWYHLDEPHPRGQWNNAIMNAFVAPAGTWTSMFGTD